MTEIRIDNTGSSTDYLYTKSAMWRDYVDCENFDEEVVLTGNRDYNNFSEASWYQRTASQSGLEEYCRKEYDIPADEELHIYQADGYIQTINWKKVC